MNVRGTSKGSLHFRGLNRHASNAGLKPSAYILALGATAAEKLKKFSQTFPSWRIP